MIDLQKEKELFDLWRSQCTGFVADGIVNCTEYEASKYKILYLMKEVNGGSNWDLREFLRKGGRARTWNNVARWTQGILNSDQEFKWAELSENNEARRQEYLNKICVVNIKKTSGKNTANHKELIKAAIANQEMLRTQISIYQADIIICCGTEGYYLNHIFQGDADWQQTSRGIWFGVSKDERNNNRIILSFSHPEARVKDCFLYYGIIDAIKEIRTKTE